MTKRLFLAIPLSESIYSALADFIDRFGVPGIKLTEKENLHITILFLGDVEEEKIEDLKSGIGSFCRGGRRFSLKFRDITWAPPGRPPRMIWAEFFPAPEFAALSHSLYDGIKKYLNPESAARPEKMPIPHITLGRFKDPALSRQAGLKKLGSMEMAAEKIQLFASKLTGFGSVYTLLAEYELQK